MRQKKGIVRTSVILDARLHKRVVEHAKGGGFCSFSEVIRDLLRKGLASHAKALRESHKTPPLSPDLAVLNKLTVEDRDRVLGVSSPNSETERGNDART